MFTDYSKAFTAAADLLEKPGAWSTHNYAKDADGTPVFPTDSEAVSWCTIGALCHVTGYGPLDTKLTPYRRRLRSVLNDKCAAAVNDDVNTTQMQIVKILRKCATKC